MHQDKTDVRAIMTAFRLIENCSQAMAGFAGESIQAVTANASFESDRMLHLLGEMAVCEDRLLYSTRLAHLHLYPPTPMTADELAEVVPLLVVGWSDRLPTQDMDKIINLSTDGQHHATVERLVEAIHRCDLPVRAGETTLLRRVMEYLGLDTRIVEKFNGNLAD